MKTAEEMATFCDENGTGSGMTRKWRLKHFQVVAAQLYDNEQVIGCFTGMHNYTGSGDHAGYYGYAITNQRIIAGQKKMIGENVSIVSLKNINDVQKNTGIMLGTINIDTIKEVIRVGIDKYSVNNVHTLLTNNLFNEEPVVISQPVEKSPISLLKEYKELLDLDIITIDEFNRKKAEILN